MNLPRLRFALLLALCAGFDPCPNVPVDDRPSDVIESELLKCPAADIAESRTEPPFYICLFNNTRRDYVSESIRATGLWEPELTARVVRVLRASQGAGDEPGMVVDVGAQLGWYTLIAASLGFNVVALEPLASQRARLLASIRLNGFEARVRVFAFAASAAPYGAQMWGSTSEGGSQWLKPPTWTPEFAASFGGHAPLAESVRTARLDDVIRAAEGEAATEAATGASAELSAAKVSASSITLVKFDVEGHLGLALAGAALTLARSRHLLVEVTPRVEAANGCDAHAILHHLHALGFRLCLPSGAAKDVCYAGEISDLHVRVRGVRAATTKETWVSTDLMLAHVQRGVGHAFTNAALTYCEGERCGELK